MKGVQPRLYTLVFVLRGTEASEHPCELGGLPGKGRLPMFWPEATGLEKVCSSGWTHWCVYGVQKRLNTRWTDGSSGAMSLPVAQRFVQIPEASGTTCGAARPYTNFRAVETKAWSRTVKVADCLYGVARLSACPCRGNLSTWIRSANHHTAFLLGAASCRVNQASIPICVPAAPASAAADPGSRGGACKGDDQQCFFKASDIDAVRSCRGAWMATYSR